MATFYALTLGSAYLFQPFQLTDCWERVDGMSSLGWYHQPDGTYKEYPIMSHMTMYGVLCLGLFFFGLVCMWLFSRWANATVAAELAAGRLPAGSMAEADDDDGDAPAATTSTAPSEQAQPRLQSLQSGEVVRDSPLPHNAQPTNLMQPAAAAAPPPDSHRRRPLAEPPPVAYFL